MSAAGGYSARSGDSSTAHPPRGGSAVKYLAMEAADSVMRLDASWSWTTKASKIIADAIHAVTKDLETLFATQAKRADDEKKRADEAERESKLIALRAKVEVETATKLKNDLIVEYERLMGEKDAVAAEAAEMRRALEPFAAYAEMRVSVFGENSRWAYEPLSVVGDGAVIRSITKQEWKSAISALALSPGEALAKHDGLADYLLEAREFSGRTFGPGRRTLGVTKHIEKEIAEVRAKPDDLTEWVDIIILACDGYWRHGGQPENLLADMLAKLAKNKARKWPAPTSEDEPVEHDRTHDDPLNAELGPEHREYWIRAAELRKEDNHA